MANKAIKYRVYPTTEQIIMFAKTFGCCRKVYNLMLSDKVESYKSTGKFATVTPAKYKKDYPYLKEVDSLALANKQLDLQEAFRKRFSKSCKKKNGFPKYKSASSRIIKKEFPQIRKSLWNELFWSQRFFLLNTGGATVDVTKQ